MAKTRIEELKTQLCSTQHIELLKKHEEENIIVEREYNRELTSFNGHWDANMEEFAAQAEDIKRNLSLKHSDEMEAFTEELEKLTSTRAKDSTKLLNLRKTQESLAKQQKFPFLLTLSYQEAHKVQQECATLEALDKEKFMADRTKRINSQKAQLKAKHDNEMNALLKRISSGQDEQKKARKAELEKLSHRYGNIRKELEAQQSMELKKFERNNKAFTSTFGKSKTNANVPLSKTMGGRKSYK